MPFDSLRAHPEAMAVRLVELTQPIPCLVDVQEFAAARVYATWAGVPLGFVDIPTYAQPIVPDRLRQVLYDHLSPLEDYPDLPSTRAVLSETVSVSIVVGTCDRPQDLRNCLRCLTSQRTRRPVEILVVDNRPQSGLTPPVVAEFPGVRLVKELRSGVAYARNAGIIESRGDIIVTVDDDVQVPSHWLETLVGPFLNPAVMAVTGNILPLELTTPSQQLFELYGNGGLGRGFEPDQVDRTWFDQQTLAVPTWELGATANAAFRASLFHHPEIGLMDETLGPGMPSGVGEDIYLFYRILKAGGILAYEPAAYVWHRHRQTMKELRKQLYNYSKGIIAYHLTTIGRDRDWRALLTILVFLPLYHIKRSLLYMLGLRRYPLSLIGVEILGNLMGPIALWRSHQRVRVQGRSEPYVPMSERSGRSDLQTRSARVYLPILSGDLSPMEAKLQKE